MRSGPAPSRRLSTAARKTVKWGGLALTVLLLVVWIGSRWILFIRVTESRQVLTLSEGQICFYFNPDHNPMPRAAWHLTESMTTQLKWSLQTFKDSAGLLIEVPLWPAAFLSLLATAAVWRADAKHSRRGRAGMCAGCGYDRVGLAAGAVCPECGSEANAG